MRIYGSTVGRQSILDNLTAQAYADQGIVIRPFAPAIPCELKLVMRAGQTLSQPAQAFVELAKSTLLQQPMDIDALSDVLSEAPSEALSGSG